jgi:hypothetical protein
MTVYWLHPWVLWALWAAAVPILIHLLARQRHREVAFPSLRFVPASQLVALRRRVLSDLPLLAIRILIVAAAVAAVAAPVFVSQSRRAQWETRVARAMIDLRVPGGTTTRPEVGSVIDAERAGAFASEVFRASGRVSDAIAEAVHWLDGQAPAGREVVIVGDLRVGSVAAGDVAVIPSHVGVRFLPVSEDATSRTAGLTAFANPGAGAALPRTLTLTLDDDATRVRMSDMTSDLESRIVVRAAPDEQALANAALDAVLAEGMRLPRDERPLEIDFEGVPPPPDTSPWAKAAWIRAAAARLPDVIAFEHEGRMIVRAGIRASDPGAVHVLDRIVRAAWRDDLDDLEPRRIGPSALAAWSRSIGGVPADAAPANEGDARWLWGAALVLLAVESLMRRPGRGTAIAARAEAESEVGVA